jgi:hypothetical protein
VLDREHSRAGTGVKAILDRLAIVTLRPRSSKITDLTPLGNTLARGAPGSVRDRVDSVRDTATPMTVIEATLV